MDGDQQPDIRVSDAEREATVKLLERHHVDGRLTWEEFSERMEAAFAARTRGDLQRTLTDLPWLDEPRPPAVKAPQRPSWQSWITPPVIVAALILLAITLGSLGGPGHPGYFPIFPLLFWGFVLARFLYPRRRRW